MIKYIGSKRRLVPLLVELVGALAPNGTVLDLFSGTARVSHGLKAAGHRVLANDHNHYASTLARCYVAADRNAVASQLDEVLAELEAAPSVDGWFTRTYAREARFLHPDNAVRIEGMRERLEALDLPEPLRSVALTSLMEAADRVDSTVGVQMAYLRSWAARALKPVSLRPPALLPGPGEAHRLDAFEAARLPADVAYLDPPYNQHRYVANYHLWETLVLWDAPEVYGKARKRVDVRGRHNPFNRKREAEAALERLIDAVAAPRLIVSFNDEGHVGREAIERILARRGPVAVLSREQDRYVGSRIGVYDPSGRRVGTPGRRTNKEHVFVVPADGVPDHLTPS